MFIRLTLIMLILLFAAKRRLSLLPTYNPVLSYNDLRSIYLDNLGNVYGLVLI